MLQRRTLLVQQFDEVAKLVLENLIEPFDETFGFVLLCSDQTALVDEVKALYHKAIPIEDKIEHVENILKKIAASKTEKYDEQLDKTYSYFQKWLDFLNYKKIFFSPIPSEATVDHLDNYLGLRAVFEERLLAIDQQIVLINGYVKLSNIDNRNALLQKLKRDMQNHVRSARQDNDEIFSVSETPLETKSIEMLLAELRDYLKQCCGHVNNQLENARETLDKFAQIDEETSQLTDLLQDDMQEKCLSLQNENSAEIESYFLAEIKEIENAINMLFDVLSIGEFGQMASLLKTELLPLPDLKTIMTDKHEELDILSTQLKKARESYLSSLVIAQSESFKQWLEFSKRLKFYEFELKQACEAMAEVDKNLIQSSLAIAHVPDTYLLKACVQGLGSKKQLLEENKTHLESMCAFLKFDLDQVKKHELVPETDAALQCYIALAELVSNAIAFFTEVNDQITSGKSETLPAFAEALIAAIKGKDANLPSLIAFIEIALVNNDIEALFGTKLFAAMEALRLSYTRWCNPDSASDLTEEESAGKEKEYDKEPEKMPELIEQEPTKEEKDKQAEHGQEPQGMLTSLSYSSYLFGFWRQPETPKPIETPRQLQDIINHLPHSMKGKGNSLS